MDIGVLRVAIATVGLLEYIKGFGKFSPCLLRMLMPAVALTLAFAFSFIPAWLADGVVSIMIAQLGYQGLIEPIKKVVERKL